jgi:hypothetical protein
MMIELIIDQGIMGYNYILFQHGCVLALRLVQNVQILHIGYRDDFSKTGGSNCPHVGRRGIFLQDSHGINGAEVANQYQTECFAGNIVQKESNRAETEGRSVLREPDPALS